MNLLVLMPFFITDLKSVEANLKYIYLTHQINCTHNNYFVKIKIYLYLHKPNYKYMKKITLFFLFLLFISRSYVNAQTTTIPDSNFEAALIALNIDTNGANGNILNTDASSFSGILDVQNQGITDLTGINSFTNITGLTCFDNALGTVNLVLPNLETLNIDRASLTGLDIDNLPLLKVCNARGNPLLTTITTTLANLNLEEARFSATGMTSFNFLTIHINLKLIEMSNNILSPSNLNYLNVFTNLDALFLDNCGLANIDLTSNIVLTNLSIIGNDFTCLNLTQNANLTGLEVNNNAYNALVIAVSNVTAANAQSGIYAHWFKDGTTTFGTSCPTASVEDFASIKFNIYPNPAMTTLSIKSAVEISKIELYNSIGQLVLRSETGKNINISHLNKGVYFCRLENINGITGLKKVIIQ